MLHCVHCPRTILVEHGSAAAPRLDLLRWRSPADRLLPYCDRSLAVLDLFVQHQQIIPAQQQQPVVPPPSLTHLYLNEVPFTMALAFAVHSAAPHLSSLDLPDAGLHSASPGLHHLITACAPSLTSLTLGNQDLLSIPQSLADAIAICTRLQHLQYCINYYTDPSDGEEDVDDDEGLNASRTTVQMLTRMATATRALPSLHSLDLKVSDILYSESLVEDAIGSLTQLTRLVASGPFSLAALRPLQNLVHLTTSYDGDKLADVQHLSRLTYLELDGDDTEVDGCTELPASLRELHLRCRMKPRQLLQLGPGLTRLSFGAIWVTLPAAAAGGADGASDEGLSGSGSGSGSVGEEGPGQVGSGAFDELLEAVGLLHGRYNGEGLIVTIGGGGSSCGRYLVARDAYTRLFAALKPLRLRKLVLVKCALGVPDVMALVEQLPELEVGYGGGVVGGWRSEAGREHRCIVSSRRHATLGRQRVFSKPLCPQLRSP